MSCAPLEAVQQARCTQPTRAELFCGTNCRRTGPAPPERLSCAVGYAGGSFAAPSSSPPPPMPHKPLRAVKTMQSSAIPPADHLGGCLHPGARYPALSTYSLKVCSVYGNVAHAGPAKRKSMYREALLKQRGQQRP